MYAIDTAISGSTMDEGTETRPSAASASAAEWASVKALICRSSVRVRLDPARYALQDVNAAHAALSGGAARGKVVIDVI